MRGFPVRIVAALASAICLQSCVVGDLAPSAALALDQPLSAAPVSSLQPLAAGAVPRPAVGTQCPVSNWASVNGKGKRLYAVRPGVGTRLNLVTMSMGTDLDLTPTRNTTPPALTPTRVDLRLVEPGGAIDPHERAVLATFLTTNRTEWNAGNEASEFYPVTAKMRAPLVVAIEENQAKLWNAFVRTLCIEVYSATAPDVPGTVPAVRVLADMASLCQVLPKVQRSAFTATFIDPREAARDCDASVNGRPKVATRAINGTGTALAPNAWVVAALSLGRKGNDTSYYDAGADGAPQTLFGQVDFGAVRPFGSDPPRWSLSAWEASGICHLNDRSAYIGAVMMRSGNRWIRVVDEKPTYTVVDAVVSRRISRLGDSDLVEPKIVRGDLARLTSADVRKIEWRAGPTTIAVSGCTGVPL
ncbi:hypothetical protein J5288_14915 [Agrobacterium sp. S2/73]|uniref:hypothetical protein n=1 Tax=unclassified Agrobacterium TaxID=2632611 RepID=UPI001ADB42A2|nr:MULTISPECIES: hypothetical protein [unclassified Agrobacterium]MBO9110007.1 hypothetical protein [Agrobacterium sp. S2/73]QXZ73966.1 hypothetical protein J5276_15255 [Agrobacterium sp. S7/73]